MINSVGEFQISKVECGVAKSGTFDSLLSSIKDLETAQEPEARQGKAAARKL
jgi:hypothetical protein